MGNIKYYTEEGLQTLKSELNFLTTVERPRISMQIAEARDKGDLSENAEYDAAKEQQGLLEMKIAKMTDHFAPLFEGTGYDVRLITAILLSAVFYIAGYKKKETYFGMNIKGNTGNLKLLEGINQFSNLVFDKIEKTTEKAIAKKMLLSGDSIEKIEQITGLSQTEIAELY